MRILMLVGIAFLITVVVFGLLLLFGRGPSPGGPGPAPVPGAGGPAPQDPGLQPVALTRDAWELRRLRAEHRGLIASIPPTPGPTPTLTAGERSDRAVSLLADNPGGVPRETPVAEDWFDPAEGLDFFRPAGGDWTPRRVRDRHPYARLFYRSDYPQGVPNFADQSIYGGIAREMAFAGVRSMPALEDPTPGMVDALRASLGWQLRDTPGPVINVWSSFTLLDGGSVHAFAVGGVMRLGVRSGGQGDQRYQYLVPGEWIGPVVVERLG